MWNSTKDKKILVALSSALNCRSCIDQFEKASRFKWTVIETFLEEKIFLRLFGEKYLNGAIIAVFRY